MKVDSHHDRRPVRVATLGLEHPHVFAMTQAVVTGGAELVAVHAGDSTLRKPYLGRHPGARVVDDAREILDDPEIDLVLIAGVPCDRATAAAEAMRCGKDVLADKPAATTLADLEIVRTTQQQTRRIFSVYFSERLESRATVKAEELVRAGAIGRVIQTVGLGPHRLAAPSRPGWFFERARAGGILADLGSHQVEQFLHFTGVVDASVVAARVANHAHPEHPELEDFGEVLLQGSLPDEGGAASGYARVDWFTPDGLATWGDVRLTLLGTEGTIEVRKNIDLAGRAGGDHLFLTDRAETRHVDCGEVDLPYAGRLLDDVVARTETALSQAHVLRTCELALRAQAAARPLPGQQIR